MTSSEHIFNISSSHLFPRFPSFVPLNSVPAALRRPQKKQVLDFQSMSYLRNQRFLYFLVFVPCAACLRRFADLRKSSPGFSEHVISEKWHLLSGFKGGYYGIMAWGDTVVYAASKKNLNVGDTVG